MNNFCSSSNKVSTHYITWILLLDLRRRCLKFAWFWPFGALPLGPHGGHTYYLNNFETPKDDSCQVWLKSNHAFSRRRWKCKKFTDDGRTTDENGRQSSSRAKKGKKEHKKRKKERNNEKKEKKTWIKTLWFLRALPRGPGNDSGEEERAKIHHAHLTTGPAQWESYLQCECGKLIYSISSVCERMWGEIQVNILHISILKTWKSFTVRYQGSATRVNLSCMRAGINSMWDYPKNKKINNEKIGHETSLISVWTLTLAVNEDIETISAFS